MLGRATRASEGHRARAAPTDGERVLPVAAPLRSVLPGGGLRRGSTVAVRSSTSLLLGLVAEASAGGAWCALVGMPTVGLVAAEEAGLVLARVALVPRPGADLVAVTAALLDGVDLVAVAGVGRLRAGDRQRLAARARHRGAVLLPVGRWPGADLEVGTAAGQWHGLAGGGAGRLRCRRARVRVGGRGAAHRGRAVSVLLPGPGGAVAGVGGSVAVGSVARTAGFAGEAAAPGSRAVREAG
ncbi:hypothetical protein [Pseudonocardia acaciae]|uniref:hypothetical protein n=1 Tax=Pseudonocardia acaciae TaxID=551276 RepID=UPI001FDEDE15|nr:hypothetical protein [Pseudonocardia acaciae]